MELTICIADSEKIEREGCLFTVANTRSFGGGLPIAPQARLDDGQLDCVFADAMNRGRLARAAGSLLRGAHLQLSEVHFTRATRVRIESRSPCALFADGEFVCETPADIRILPQVLQVYHARK
jgi:diacylglycerol kinase (ATP)